MTVAPEVSRIRAAVAASVGEVASARTLPAECYTSAEFFEFEKRVVFNRTWLFACHLSEIPRPRVLIIAGFQQMDRQSQQAIDMANENAARGAPGNTGFVSGNADGVAVLLDLAAVEPSDQHAPE